jgi:3-hydroxymyristoyl/3-hydroxydecanoyl-(acyl carrier protein) dehydratase
MKYYEDALKGLVPHRGIALCIDDVKYDPENSKDSVDATKFVAEDDPRLEGHFMGMSIFPGHWIIECGQIACAALARLMFPELKGYTIVRRFEGGDIEFKTAVVPGDTLYIHAQLLKSRGPIFYFSFEVTNQKKEEILKIERVRGALIPEKI